MGKALGKCHQKVPVNAMEERKSIDNMQLSTMMAGRLDQRCSVNYRGMLQLGCHQEHSATRHNSLKSPNLQSKMSAPFFHVNSLHTDTFLHRMLRNTLIVIHEEGGAHQMLYAHLCPLRQPQYRLYSRYLCRSLSGLNKPWQCYLDLRTVFWDMYNTIDHMIV